MKIPTGRSQPPQQMLQIHKAPRIQIAHLALGPPPPKHPQQSGIEQLFALLVPQALPHNHLDCPILIFQ
jgi:hypothetical protein